jgi:hypothetical protein
MTGIEHVGRFLILAGTVVIVIGLVFLMADKFPLGRLPGDFRFTLGRFRVHIPIVTCVLFSLLLTLLFNFFSRR